MGVTRSFHGIALVRMWAVTPTGGAPRLGEAVTPSTLRPLPFCRRISVPNNNNNNVLHFRECNIRKNNNNTSLMANRLTLGHAPQRSHSNLSSKCHPPHTTSTTAAIPTLLSSHHLLRNGALANGQPRPQVPRLPLGTAWSPRNYVRCGPAICLCLSGCPAFRGRSRLVVAEGIARTHSKPPAQRWPLRNEAVRWLTFQTRRRITSNSTNGVTQLGTHGRKLHLTATCSTPATPCTSHLPRVTQPTSPPLDTRFLTATPLTLTRVLHAGVPHLLEVILRLSRLTTQL